MTVSPTPAEGVKLEGSPSQPQVALQAAPSSSGAEPAASRSVGNALLDMRYAANEIHVHANVAYWVTVPGDRDFHIRTILKAADELAVRAATLRAALEQLGAQPS